MNELLSVHLWTNHPASLDQKKYGVLQLRIKPAVRDLISSEQARAGLPQDIAPNLSSGCSLK